MAPFLKQFCLDQNIALDQALYNELNAKNEEAFKKFDDRLEDAEKNLGETDISEALIDRANYLARIGDKVPFISRCR